MVADGGGGEDNEAELGVSFWAVVQLPPDLTPETNRCASRLECRGPMCEAHVSTAIGDKANQGDCAISRVGRRTGGADRPLWPSSLPIGSVTRKVK